MTEELSVEQESDLMIDMCDPETLFMLAQKLAKRGVFGPWTATGRGFVRHDPNSAEPRVRVWEATETDPNWCPYPGWYFELGSGVLAISRISNARGQGFLTLAGCCEHVDELLTETGAILCGGIPCKDSDGN